MVDQSSWNLLLAEVSRPSEIAGLDHDGDGLDRCVHSAYLDLSRTLVGIATFADAGAWHRGTAGFLKMRLEELALLSPWSRDEFDAWHRVIASELINTSRDLAFPLTVGQAQKWVNMSIKNGIALGERLKPGLSSVCEVAHVALDQVVLEGLRWKKGMPRQLSQRR